MKKKRTERLQKNLHFLLFFTSIFENFSDFFFFIRFLLFRIGIQYENYRKEMHEYDFVLYIGGEKNTI